MGREFVGRPRSGRGSTRILMDGVDDYVRIDASSGDYDFGTGDVAIRFAIKITDAASNPRVLIRRDGSTERGFSLQFFSNKLRANFGQLSTASARTVRDTAATLSDGVLYQVGVFFDNSSGAVTFTLNGADSNGSYLNQNGAGQSTTATSDLFIGVDATGNTTTGGFFNGTLYDVRIYDDLAGTNLVSRHLGTGNTDADWEDQAGSNDGTVNGSPGTVII